MKCIVKIASAFFAFFASFTAFGAVVNNNVPAEEPIIIRRVSEDRFIDEDSVKRWVYKDEYVRKDGETHIIFDEITTKNTYNKKGILILHRKTQKSITKATIDSFPKFRECFTIHDDSLLIVNLVDSIKTKIKIDTTEVDTVIVNPRKGNLRLFYNDTLAERNNICDTIEYGKCDTIKLKELISLLNKNESGVETSGVDSTSKDSVTADSDSLAIALFVEKSFVHFVPDSIPGGRVYFGAMQKTYTPIVPSTPEPETDNCFWKTPLGKIVLVIGVIIILIIGLCVMLKCSPKVRAKVLCFLGKEKSTSGTAIEKTPEHENNKRIATSEGHESESNPLEKEKAKSENSSEVIDGGQEDTPYDSEEDDKRVETPEQLKDEIAKLQNQLQRANKELRETQESLDAKSKELEKERASREETIENRVKKIEADCKKKVKAAEDDRDKKVSEANSRAEQARKKSESIERKLNDEFDRERSSMNEAKKRVDDELKKKKDELNATTTDLNKERGAHKATKEELATLTEETKIFRERLKSASHSQEYCREIDKLLSLSEKVQKTGKEIIDSNLSDPYHVYKALALFNSKINDIKLTQFYNEIEMVAKTGFIIQGSPFPTEKSEVVTYFFTQYLKSYIDALVVLNESLIGLKHILEDEVKKSHIVALETYREELYAVLKDLRIQVSVPRIFDNVGDKTELHVVEELDAGFSHPGTILEIMNCKVSLVGGTPSKDRILVKTQK